MYFRDEVGPFPPPGHQKLARMGHRCARRLQLLRAYFDAYYDTPTRVAFVTCLWPNNPELGKIRMHSLLEGTTYANGDRVIKAVREELGILWRAYDAFAQNRYLTDPYDHRWDRPAHEFKALPIATDPEDEFLAGRSYSPDEIRRILAMPERERSLHQQAYLTNPQAIRSHLTHIWGGGQTTPTGTPRPVLAIVPRRGLRHAS